MSHLSDRLASVDRLVRRLSLRLELYRNRVAGKSKNPALAEQAAQLLPAMGTQLDELVRYRKRLAHALEVETYLSPEDQMADRPPLVPRYMR
jgi:hypothetical protein